MIKKILKKIINTHKKIFYKYYINKYILNSKVLKLNIGCGSNCINGWLNTDIDPALKAVYLNACNMSYIKDESFDAVFCEHMIEHVEKDKALQIIKEAYRILKPHGVIRIVTPSLNKFIRILEDKDNTYLEWYRRYNSNTKLDLLDSFNDIFYKHGHKYIWTEESMKYTFESIGFTNINITKTDNYINKIFNGIDGHGEIIGNNINDIEAFGIEATK